MNRLPAWIRPVALALLLAEIAGCGPKPPPTDKATEQQQMKELNEARQREWGNKKVLADFGM